ncbi:MAG: glutamine phosphoribosylpyrophosphate amidotransferase [Candidatus Latescibacteria bacterium]|nr:glutamine phosphoribosylpyrophosphate amidotransferase [Candidatus Latescibacterota bacterium]
MCGIVGYLNKSGAVCPIGRTMLSMLQALGRRGPDSAGIAVYGPEDDETVILRVKLGEHTVPAGRKDQVVAQAETLARVTQAVVTGEYLRLVVEYDGQPAALQQAIETVAPDVEVVSIGRALEIVKQVGSPDNLDATYGVAEFVGTHAIGHTRLSTESRVDLSHSQPFWAHGTLDIAAVHNGHITNYHKLRRQYEMRGVRFYTENDSEIIGMYLADRMAQGLSFDQALRASIRDLDGSFCYLAATADQLGFAKDSFGLKPLMVTETDEYVAIATEELALCAAFGQAVQAREPGPKSVRTWRLTAERKRQKGVAA